MTGPAGYVHVVSLGCPKNLVDTEVLTASLFRAGLGLAEAADNADLYLINTCAFIAAARAEAAGEIAAAVAWKGKRAGRRVIVCGCLPQWDADGAFRAGYPEVDAWLGIDQAPSMGPLLGKLLAGMGLRDSQFGRSCYLYDESTPRLQLTPPHYAYLKIAEGCDNCCAYCSIPRIRGHLRSRRIASVVTEARNLLANGVRELILIGQDTTAFGLDRPGDGEDLVGLLQALDALPGRFWLRLLYAHPASLSRTPQFTDGMVAAFRRAQHLVPYLDLPLQHITDRMLARMGRRVDRPQVEALLDRLRRDIPGLVLRTTFLVGHPGETEDDFRDLHEAVLRRRFDRMGVFAYSFEPGTAAAGQDGAVAADVAQARAEDLMAVQAEIMRERNVRLVGSEMECIVDGVGATGGLGRTAMDAPDIDLAIHIAGVGPRDVGHFRRVRITGADTYELSAQRIKATSGRGQRP
jgi:ribosomal protein S12 methylthiotransferase